MFIVSVTFLTPLDQVEPHVAAHRAFLRDQYGRGTLLMSGRNVPPDGGIIVANTETRAELEELVKLDPFYIAGLARYDITEFRPTMTAEAFAAFRAD